jgi:hypothetical protein
MKFLEVKDAAADVMFTVLRENDIKVHYRVGQDMWHDFCLPMQKLFEHIVGGTRDDCNNKSRIR